MRQLEKQCGNAARRVPRKNPVFVRGGHCHTCIGGPQQQLEYSDWWGQVGVIGGGGLLPVHWDSVIGKG